MPKRSLITEQVHNLAANINHRGGIIVNVKASHEKSQHFYTVTLCHGKHHRDESFDAASAAFRWLQAYSYGMLEGCDK